MNKIISILSVPAFLLCIVGCGGKKGDKVATTGVGDPQTKTALVEVQKLEKTLISKIVDFSANLEGYESLNVSPSMQGRIEKIYVDVGSRVRKGQDIAVLDQTQYSTTELAFTNLQIEFDRVTALLESGSVSQQVYDQTKLQYDQTKRNLDRLATNTFVKAGISGVVVSKNYEEGELYTALPIVVISQLNVLRAYVNIPERYFPLVKAGMNVDIKTDIYPDAHFKGTIELVFPTIDPYSHSFQAKIKIPNGDEKLRPGMYVDVTIGLGEINTIIAPYQSVLKLQGSNERYVFVNDNGYAKRVSVTLGQRFDDKIEIISNELHNDDELVVVGQAKLVNGTKLEIGNR